MKTLGSVAEGVSTTEAVKTVIDELGINAPIAQAVRIVAFFRV
jgi:glycerol-3-phosphate dehydrogenase